MGASASPILIVGAGSMGGALIAGWMRTGAFRAAELIVRDPTPGVQARDARLAGARLNLADAELAGARSVVLAVKPAMWREAALAAAPHLAVDAIVVSIVAGVAAADIGEAFAGRPVARAMPTTAAAIGQGATSLYAQDPAARRRAHALFEPLGAVVDLDDEDQMHAATAVGGSAPAYLYAFVEALEDAGIAVGLARPVAERLARSTLAGAAALMANTGEDPARLRQAVTSPGGTTQAALRVFAGADGLGDLMARAVAAAVARSRQLGQ